MNPLTVCDAIIGRLGLIRCAKVRAMMSDPVSLRYHILRFGPPGHDLMTPDQHEDLCDYSAAQEGGRVAESTQTISKTQ